LINKQNGLFFVSYVVRTGEKEGRGDANRKFAEHFELLLNERAVLLLLVSLPSTSYAVNNSAILILHSSVGSNSQKSTLRMTDRCNSRF
jgi:hypothetical protein